MRNKASIPILVAALFMSLTSCGQKSSSAKTEPTKTKKETNNNMSTGKLDTITFGGGCFWCTEAIFQRLKGVTKVESGYSGGRNKNPTYKEVCSGLTGHAEVIQVTYDTSEISLAEILEVFFKTHDPTTLNKQGADAGTQYRSVIFYRNEEQKKVAEDIKQGLDKSGAFDKPIVTEISAYDMFWKAEDYHQDYYNQNKNSNSYCAYAIVPKIEKFEQYCKDKIKKQ